MATDMYEETADLSDINGNESDEAKEQVEGEEVEGEEEEEENESTPLTGIIVGEGLSLINKVSDGFAHAYVRLSLKDRSLSNIECIHQFIHLRYVDISNNFIKSLQPLENLKTLLVLKCDNNKISTIDLPTMQFLQILSLNNNKIKSTEGMDLPFLEQLSLNENQITEITGLDPTIFPNLHTLELRGNKISSTRGINLPNLKHLYLGANSITDLTNVDNLVNLETLHLRENSQLSNLDGLAETNTSLKTINLRSTEVSSFGDIFKLGKIQVLSKLVLTETPISNEANYRVEVLSYMKSLVKLDKDEITEEEISEALEIQRQRIENDVLSETEQVKDGES